MANERVKMVSTWKIEKFKGDFKSREEAIKKGVKPYEVRIFKKNLALNEGVNALWNLVCGASFIAFDNSNAHIGVGDSDVAAVATQTGLQGANKKYKGMDTGYPSYGSDQKATWRATFGGTDANFAWKEITVANGDSDASVNLNRKVESMGTKSEGSTWTVSVEITAS